MTMVQTPRARRMVHGPYAVSGRWPIIVTAGRPGPFGSPSHRPASRLFCITPRPHWLRDQETMDEETMPGF